jgi:hypothetical protein
MVSLNIHAGDIEAVDVVCTSRVQKTPQAKTFVRHISFREREAAQVEAE